METPHVGRVVERRRGLDGVIDGIASLPRSDRTSILMAAMGEAAPAVTASEVLDRHHEDRFVRPGTVDHDLLADTQHRLLAALGGRTERIVVAPLVPFGTHHALGGTPQDNVVTTVRATEVAADPTIGLALEAAARRRVLLADDERTADRVDLATVQRVTRAQRFEGPTSFAHFTLAGRVTAGRDTGNGDFEVETISDHIDGWRRGLAECGLDGVEITVSDFCGRHTPILDRILARVGDGHRDVHRTQGQGYYDDLCLSLDVVADGTRHDIGDGGRVTWAARMLSSQKERLLISGVGVDRVALLRRGSAEFIM